MADNDSCIHEWPLFAGPGTGQALSEVGVILTPILPMGGKKKIRSTEAFSSLPEVMQLVNRKAGT